VIVVIWLAAGDCSGSGYSSSGGPHGPSFGGK
jgi:hypothetical protein